MTTRSFTNPRILSCLLGLVLAMGATACSGGSGSGGPSSPTAPALEAAPMLSTQWGELTVQSNGYIVDLARARASIEEGYAKARRQIGSEADRMWLAGYRITVMPPDWHLNGQHLRDQREIRIRAGVENVLEHELQHLFAWELGRFSECRTYQDHPGGFDLLCNPL